MKQRQAVVYTRDSIDSGADGPLTSPVRTVASARDPERNARVCQVEITVAWKYGVGCDSLPSGTTAQQAAQSRAWLPLRFVTLTLARPVQTTAAKKN